MNADYLRDHIIRFKEPEKDGYYRFLDKQYRTKKISPRNFENRFYRIISDPMRMGSYFWAISYRDIFDVVMRKIVNECESFQIILHENNRGFQIRGHVNSPGDPLILIMFEEWTFNSFMLELEKYYSLFTSDELFKIISNETIKDIVIKNYKFMEKIEGYMSSELFLLFSLLI